MEKDKMMFSFLLKFFIFEIIVDLVAAVRRNTEKIHVLLI